jgi:Cupin domain
VVEIAVVDYDVKWHSPVKSRAMDDLMKDLLRPVKRGTQDRSAEFNGFTLTETVRHPGLALPRHYHAYTNLGLVLRGGFVETIGERPCEVSPGSLILQPAGEMHANHYDRIEARCLIIEIQRVSEVELAVSGDLPLRAFVPATVRGSQGAYWLSP